MARARASTSPEQEGLQSAARLKPWRRAFCAARALPAAVRGPVLACALRRLASSLRALVMLPPGAALGARDSRTAGPTAASSRSCCIPAVPAAVPRGSICPGRSRGVATFPRSIVDCDVPCIRSLLSLFWHAAAAESPEGVSGWPARARCKIEGAQPSTSPRRKRDRRPATSRSCTPRSAARGSAQTSRECLIYSSVLLQKSSGNLRHYFFQVFYR